MQYRARKSDLPEESNFDFTTHPIMRAIGTEVLHKQAYMMATLVQELRNEEQFMADFAHGVV